MDSYAVMDLAGHLRRSEAPVGGDKLLEDVQSACASEVAERCVVEDQSDGHGNGSSSRRSPGSGTACRSGSSSSRTVPHRSSLVRSAVNRPVR
jgi:hypothetical protein